MLRRPVRRRGRARGRTVWRWLLTSGNGRAAGTSAGGETARGKDGCVPPPILDRTASTYDVGRRGDSFVLKAASSHVISANMASRGAAYRANSVRMRSNTASDSAARAADSCRRCSLASSAANTASWRRRSSTSVRAADSTARAAASCRRCSSAFAANSAARTSSMRSLNSALHEAINLDSACFAAASADR